MARTIVDGTAEAGGGRPLPAGVRERLERAFGADLSAVRLHTGGEADRMARALGAEAFACGSAVFFRAGAYRPHTPTGLRLLAHEIAHVVQHARGDAGGVDWSASRPGDQWEVDAERRADRVMRGQGAPGGADARVVVTAGPSRLIQRHASYEHRILGDGPTDDLVSVSRQDQRGDVFLRNQIALLDKWSEDPLNVKKSTVDALCPWIKTLYLGPDNVLVTYGELNALPDYLPDPAAYETTGKKTLLPILQVLRQEGYNALSKLLNGVNPRKQFDQSIVNPRALEPLYTVQEILALDDLTVGRGVYGKDHYAGILARNACHFAPYSWYRWKLYHQLARNYAGLAHSSKKDEFVELAWMFHGYADHFLQDSFAAGHLINKTLVMQWFVEWASAAGVSVSDLDVINEMRLGLQPHLSASWLYGSDEPGPSDDPQTAQQAQTVVARFLDSNLVDNRRSEEFTTYQKYLTFVTSSAANLVAVDLHNHYNETSLWVSSLARPTPYKVWGDLTLLSGPDGVEGVRATSDAAQLSQRSLREILNTGTTSISVPQIRSHFPIRAGAGKNDIQPLRGWHETIRPASEKIFDSFFPDLTRRVAALAKPRLGIVSEDQRLAGVWARQLKAGSSASVEILVSNGRVFAGSNGYIAELNPSTGAIEQLQPLSSSAPGDYTTRIATDGQYLYAGAHGFVYARSLDDLKKSAWPACPVGWLYGRVNVLLASGRLYAGTVGTVYEINPRTGVVAREVSLGPVLATTEVRLAADKTRLYAGLPKSVSAVTLGDVKVAWSRPTGNPAPTADTEVLLAGGRLYGGVNGTVFELDPGTGRVLHERTVTATAMANGDVDTRLAVDARRLYAGYNGNVYAVGLRDWTKEWTLKVGGKDDFRRADVLVAGNRLYAGSQGHVYEITPESGETPNVLRLTFLDPLGLDHPTMLAIDGRGLYAGVDGSVYKVLAQDSWLDGNIAHDWYDGRWHGWTTGFDGGTHMQAVSGAMARNLEMFAIGEAGTVYHDWYDGRWHGWEPNFRAAPPMRTVAAVMGFYSLEVLGIGLDGTLYWNWYDGEWHHWDEQDALGPVRDVTGVRYQDYVYIFVVTKKGRLIYDRFDLAEGRWSGWLFDLDPVGPLDTVSVIAGPSRLDLFVIDAQGQLLHNWRGGGSWKGWVRNFDKAQPMRAVSGVMGRKNLEVFGIGLDSTLYHNWYDGSWHGWQPDFRAAPARVRAVTGVMGDNLEIFAVGLDGTLYHNWYDGDWHLWETNFDYLRQQVRDVFAIKGKSHVEVFAVASGDDR